MKWSTGHLVASISPSGSLMTEYSLGVGGEEELRYSGELTGLSEKSPRAHQISQGLRNTLLFFFFLVLVFNLADPGSMIY